MEANKNIEALLGSESLGTDIDETLAFIHQLNGGLTHVTTHVQLQQLIENILKKTMIYYMVIESFPCVRGRKVRLEDVERGISKGGQFTLPSAFSYPSAETITKYGRCHKPHSPIFYGSRIAQTVFSELDVNVGDVVLSGQWVMNPPKRAKACFLGVVDHYRKTKILSIPTNSPQEYSELNSILNKEVKQRLQSKEGLISVLIDAFLSDIFSRQASTYNDFKLTSIVSDCLFNMFHFDLISYPSVKHYGSANYAIKTDFLDSNFSLRHVKIVRIMKMLGYGLYDARTVTETVVPRNATEIIWPEKELNKSLLQ